MIQKGFAAAVGQIEFKTPTPPAFQFLDIASIL